MQPSMATPQCRWRSYDAQLAQLSAQLQTSLARYRPYAPGPANPKALRRCSSRLAPLRSRRQVRSLQQSAEMAKPRGALRLLICRGLSRTPQTRHPASSANLAEATARAERVLEGRRRAENVALVLMTSAIGLAAIACWLVLRAEASAALLREQHERMTEERAQELEQFAERVAHDIQSPLSATKLSIDAIARGPCDAAHARGAIERGKRSIAHVTDVVDALLTFSKAAGHPSPFAHANLRATVSEAVEDSRVDAERANVSLDVGPVADVDVVCAPGFPCGAWSTIWFRTPSSTWGIRRVARSRSLLEEEVTAPSGSKFATPVQAFRKSYRTDCSNHTFGWSKGMHRLDWGSVWQP